MLPWGTPADESAPPGGASSAGAENPIAHPVAAEDELGSPGLRRFLTSEELLMPTALKRKATGEQLRRFLWWASLSTSYANFLMFFVIDIEAIKAGTGAVLEQNRSGGDCFFNCFFEAFFCFLTFT